MNIHCDLHPELAESIRVHGAEHVARVEEGWNFLTSKAESFLPPPADGGKKFFDWKRRVHRKSKTVEYLVQDLLLLSGEFVAAARWRYYSSPFEVKPSNNPSYPDVVSAERYSEFLGMPCEEWAARFRRRDPALFEAMERMRGTDLFHKAARGRVKPLETKDLWKGLERTHPDSIYWSVKQLVEFGYLDPAETLVRKLEQHAADEDIRYLEFEGIQSAKPFAAKTSYLRHRILAARATDPDEARSHAIGAFAWDLQSVMDNWGRRNASDFDCTNPHLGIAALIEFDVAPGWSLRAAGPFIPYYIDDFCHGTMAQVIEHGAWAPPVESLGVLGEHEILASGFIRKKPVPRRRYDEFWKEISGREGTATAD